MPKLKGLTLEEAERFGVGAEHPEHPSRKAAGRSKYGAVRTDYDGVTYASKAEASRARRLDDDVADGLTLWWIGQPKFRLGCPENVYVADFLVVKPGGVVIVEDVKGVHTPKFERDLKLWRAYGPCPLHVVSGKNTEIIVPIGISQ